MQRVAVIGCSGSGKTTLARELGKRLGVPVVHGDFLGHRAGARAQGAEWEAAHRAAVNGEAWVFDAMRLSTLEERLVAADTVVFLDLARVALFWGVARRRARHRGRMDPSTGVADAISPSLVKWMWRFHSRDRPRILAILERHTETTRIVILRSRAATRRFLASLEPTLQQTVAKSP